MGEVTGNETKREMAELWRSQWVVADCDGKAVPSTIAIRQDHQYNTLSHTVQLKGFASRINFDDVHTRDVARRMVHLIVAFKPKRIAWDGDDFNNDSFTRLIPEIYNELQGAVELVAFVRECDQERFTRSWEATRLPVNLYVCPLALDWYKLGIHALQLTGSHTVVCLGGGETVAAEFAAKSSTLVKFTMFVITRPTNEQGGLEYPALMHCSTDDLRVVI